MNIRGDTRRRGVTDHWKYWRLTIILRTPLEEIIDYSAVEIRFSSQQLDAGW
jgi:hypothetical protein